MYGVEFKFICNKKNRLVIELFLFYIKYEDCIVLKFWFFFLILKYFYFDFIIDCIYGYKFCFIIIWCIFIFFLIYILYLEYLKVIINGYLKFECLLF